MRAFLRPHPDFGSTSVVRIEVEARRTASANLILDYLLVGEVDEITLPPPSAPERLDELWRTTCFEAFLRSADGYYELNLSPSGAWNAYRFGGYRSGMERAPGIETPAIEAQRDGDRYRLAAAIDLSRLAGLAADEDWFLGLSAVIEERSGGKSYWALAHPPGKPDFHHSDCFALELAPAATT